MFVAHKIALDPTNVQWTYCAKACGTARFAYHWALAEWQRQNKEEGKPSEAALRQQLNKLEAVQCPRRLEVTKNAPQQAIKNVGAACQRFFAGQGRYPLVCQHVMYLSCVLLLLTLAPAYAEIYKWVDRDGRVHFTDTTADIPPEYRDRMEEQTRTAPAPPSTPEPPQTRPERLSVAPTPASTSYEIPLRREGNAMLVEAVLDRTMHAHLLLDTGAEFTVLSPAVARSLALNLKDAAVLPLRSASGVFFAPMMKVQSITVGEAAVYDVEVIVHDATPGLDGLLGMSFLNNFLVTISGRDHKLILTPLAENPHAELYGGHAQDWWVRKFRFYRGQIDNVKRYMGMRYTPELERTLRYFQVALETLDHQASQAGVPRRWRD